MQPCCQAGGLHDASEGVGVGNMELGKDCQECHKQMSTLENTAIEIYFLSAKITSINVIYTAYISKILRQIKFLLEPGDYV